MFLILSQTFYTIHLKKFNMKTTNRLTKRPEDTTPKFETNSSLDKVQNAKPWYKKLIVLKFFYLKIVIHTM